MNFKAGDGDHPIRGVSADISEVVDIAHDGGIGQVVVIHAAPDGEWASEFLRKGYGERGFGGIVYRTDEITTVES